MSNCFTDNRGELFFPLKNANIQIKDGLVSVNKKNVFRGIHISQFTKIVTCIQGRILDIIINFNKGEEDYLIPKYYVLDSTTEQYQVLVKPNHGHAFLSLCENSIVLYHFDDIYTPEKTKNINYKDPIFNIIPTIEKYATCPLCDIASGGISEADVTMRYFVEDAVCNKIIISENDKNSPFYMPIDYCTIQKSEALETYYVFGGNGFIGSTIIDYLQNNKKSVYKTELRLENLEKIEYELDLYKPKYVICSAGLTGTPNISWCETHRTETIETNITYQMTLAHLCNKRNIHLTIIGSGAIFNNDKYYTEDEEGNYSGNFYGKCRIFLENMVKNYDNVFYIRIIYPISHKKSDKNLITKLLSFSTIQNNTITLTYLDELIPYMIDMIEHGDTGICNLVNDGKISLFDIVDIYHKKTGREFVKILTNTDNNKSNALLSIGKLEKYNVNPVKDAVEECISKYIECNL